MKEVFPIVPASSGAFWIVGGLLLLMAALVGLFGWIAWAARFTTFEVTSQRLAIHGDLYSRSIPRTELRVDEARIVNLNVDRAYRLVVRTNGCGLPGYASGWFRLANGEKALAFVTSTDATVYLPTTAGYSLLLSPAQPEQFLAALRGAR